MARRAGQRNSVTVRPLAPHDFDFIRSLASTISGYTVCSPYLLWMLGKFQGSLCCVAMDAEKTQLGYLLAIPTSEPPNCIFVWQLATTFRGKRLKAQYHLARHLRRVMRDRGARKLFYTSVPLSSAERSVRTIASQVFHATPERKLRVPDSESREFEYVLYPSIE